MNKVAIIETALGSIRASQHCLGGPQVNDTGHVCIVGPDECVHHLSAYEARVAAAALMAAADEVDA